MLLCAGEKREIEERQKAEIEFVQSAYASEEAWVVVTHTGKTSSSSTCREKKHECSKICRLLKLDYFGSEIVVELLLVLPEHYPVSELSPLGIEACISTTSTSYGGCPQGRKMAMDAIPNLIKVCRSVAKENVGQEAIFAVLSRADEWVIDYWQSFVEPSPSASVGNGSNASGSGTSNSKRNKYIPSKKIILARRLIYSHHIIAKTKRKAIADLSRAYHLGGYAKIGWPGIIIIEGEEGNCNKFTDEIRSMRWQHLVVRGEELIPIDFDFDVGRDEEEDLLDRQRVFPLKMEELGEDQMSDLAAICRDAGAEDLFKTSMKIYKKTENNSGNDEIETATAFSEDQSHHETRYGVFVHVDHMNDRKSYEKWIRKACKSADCNYIVHRFYKTNNDSNSTPLHHRPIIFVCIWGDERNVKQIMKRWRTSRVDVDSKGNSCLERMMSVLIEGEVLMTGGEQDQLGSCEIESDGERESVLRERNDCLDDATNCGISSGSSTLDEVKISLRNLGGPLWEDAAVAFLQY